MTEGGCSGECGCGGGRSAGTDVREPEVVTARSGDARSAGMSRRGVLMGSAMVAASLALAACGDSADPEAPSTPTPTPEETSPTAQETPSDDESTPAAGGGEELTSTDAFPTGGGVVVSSSVGNVVVTQPADGEFKAFNAKCPHAGCTVDEIKENVIECPCHHSTFDAATGDRLGGEAPRGLTPVAVTVSGGKVLLA